MRQAAALVVMTSFVGEWPSGDQVKKIDLQNVTIFTEIFVLKYITTADTDAAATTTTTNSPPSVVQQPDETRAAPFLRYLCHTQ